MALTEAQKRAQRKYVRESVKQKVFEAPFSGVEMPKTRIILQNWG